MPVLPELPPQQIDELLAAALPRYVTALADADPDAALAVASGLLAAGVSYEVVLESLLGGAQTDVGRRWERDEWSVAREHAATEVTEAVLARLSVPERAAPLRGHLVTVCVEGEWHSLASRIVTAVLRANGYAVRSLGPSTPARELSRQLATSTPDALLVSCSLAVNLPGARRVIEVGRSHGMPVLAGGRGFGGNGRFAIALGANAWAPSATAALPVLAELGRFSTAAPPLALAGEAEYRDISRSLPTHVGGATAALADRCPPLRPALRGQDDDQLDHLRDEFAFFLRTIAAAVLVNAAEVIGEYLDWLARIFAARGRSHRLLPLTVEAAVLALEPFPRARGLLAGAASARYGLAARPASPERARSGRALRLSRDRASSASNPPFVTPE